MATREEDLIVTMEDGTIENFGTRGTLTIQSNLEEGTVKFLLASGAVINWAIPYIDGISGFVREVYVHGLLEKVRASIASVSLENRAETISRVVGVLNTGEFPVRVVGTGKLDLWQEAFALTIAAQGGEQSHWAETDNATVIAEVLGMWKSYDAQKRRDIRKHKGVVANYGMLVAKQLDESKVDALTL